MKIPPHSKENEIVLLGSCLIERPSFGKVASELTKDDFYEPKHAIIWNAMSEMYSKFEPIDIVTVTAHLRATKQLDKVGGALFVTSLIDTVASALNLEKYAMFVKQHSIQRNIIKALQDGLNSAYDESLDCFEFSKDIAFKIEKSTTEVTPNMRSIGKVAIETYDEIKKAELRGGDLLGLPSSIEALNKKMLGYCAPDITIIAAGTGEGKSTFMLNEVKRIASEGHPVAVFSLEMKDYQLLWKILSSEIGLDVKSIRQGKLNKGQWDELYNTVSDLQEVPVYLYDTSGLNIDKFCGIVKEGVRKYGLKTVFVDYIQLITVANMKDFTNKEAQINYISKRIKRLAMELNIPIQVLSQLSRIERGTKRRYKLSDLRESGAIEQDADNVIFTFRPSYHGIEEMEIFNNEGFKETIYFSQDDCLLLIEKMRLGETGTIRCKFNGQYSRFEDMPQIEHNSF